MQTIRESHLEDMGKLYQKTAAKNENIPAEQRALHKALLVLAEKHAFFLDRTKILEEETAKCVTHDTETSERPVSTAGKYILKLLSIRLNKALGTLIFTYFHGCTLFNILFHFVSSRQLGSNSTANSFAGAQE